MTPNKQTPKGQTLIFYLAWKNAQNNVVFLHRVVASNKDKK